MWLEFFIVVGFLVCCIAIVFVGWHYEDKGNRRN